MSCDAFIVEGGDVRTPQYLCAEMRDGVFFWCSDPECALHMARKQDAEALLYVVSPTARAVPHTPHRA